MSLSTWRHGDTWRQIKTPCPYLHGNMEKLGDTGRHGDSPCPYSHGDMEPLNGDRETFHVQMLMETLHVHIHMKTWRQSMSILTWRHVDTYWRQGDISCPMNMDPWTHPLSISTWKHGFNPCPSPLGDKETLHVHIHMET